MTTSAFGKAFAAARKAGKKVFEFNGKSYNTKYKEELGVQKSSPPKARPSDTKSNTSSRPAPRPSSSAPKADSPKAKSDFQQLKENTRASRDARNKARADNTFARDMVKKVKAVPNANNTDKSKLAVKKAMNKAAGANFR
jgi:hypothetical protein